MEKLNVKSFALAWGIAFGVYAIFLGWVGASGWGTSIVDIMSSLYIGYEPTFIGGIIGGIWAFVGAGIGGAIIASVYNIFAK